MGQFTGEMSHRRFAREFPSEEPDPSANPRPRSPDRGSTMGQTTDTVPFRAAQTTTMTTQTKREAP